MEVHVCDVNDRVGLASHKALAAQNKRHVIELHGMSNGVTAMVEKVVKEAANSPTGMIDKLAIWGHGGSGSVGLSRGEESARNADWAGIDIENLIDPTLDADGEGKGERMRATLRKLWDVLSWGGMVELRGCDVAKGVRGQQFLTVLATIWEVRVRAGLRHAVRPQLGLGGDGSRSETRHERHHHLPG